MAKKIKESRALIGGNLDSKEKTEYEDWLEKVHKKIDKNKGVSDELVPPLFDDEATENGYHCDCGKLYKDIKKLHKDEEDMKNSIKESRRYRESDEFDFEEDDFEEDSNGKFDEVEDFPEWALNYVVNGESEDLSDADIAEIENFLDDENIDSVVSNDEESYVPFNKYPAFGDACGTYTVYVKRF